MIVREDFSLELIDANALVQNVVAVSQKKYSGKMMRCLLRVVDLGPEYWSFVLTYEGYIKKWVSHRLTSKTPFEAITG